MARAWSIFFVSIYSDRGFLESKFRQRVTERAIRQGSSQNFHHPFYPYPKTIPIFQKFIFSFCSVVVSHARVDHKMGDLNDAELPNSEGAVTLDHHVGHARHHVSTKTSRGRAANLYPLPFSLPPSVPSTLIPSISRPLSSCSGLCPPQLDKPSFAEGVTVGVTHGHTQVCRALAAEMNSIVEQQECNSTDPYFFGIWLSMRAMCHTNI